MEKKKEAGRKEEETVGKEGVDGKSGERQADKYNGCLLSLRSFVPGMGSESAHGSRMQGFGYSPGKNITSRPPFWFHVAQWNCLNKFQLHPVKSMSYITSCFRQVVRP